MLVNDWVDTVWTVLLIRPRTLHDYKRLYRRHLEPVIGHLEIEKVEPKDPRSSFEGFLAKTQDSVANASSDVILFENMISSIFLRKYLTIKAMRVSVS